MCWDCQPSWLLGTETSGCSGDTAQPPPSDWSGSSSLWPCSMESCHYTLGSPQACRLGSREGEHSSSEHDALPRGSPPGSTKGVRERNSLYLLGTIPPLSPCVQFSAPALLQRDTVSSRLTSWHRMLALDNPTLSVCICHSEVTFLSRPGQ